jgi:hypothetical protein
LKAGEWFRRARLLMASPVHSDYRRCQAEIPLIVLCRFPEPALASVGGLFRYFIPASRRAFLIKTWVLSVFDPKCPRLNP